jgi:hypothetical protein
MPSVKSSIDIGTAHLLRAKALRENRTVSDVIKRAIINDLAIAPAPTPDAVVERHNDGRKKLIGAYLSQALARGIERISVEQGRSVSHVLRDLVRTELRRRGVLPPVSNDRDRFEEK